MTPATTLYTSLQHSYKNCCGNYQVNLLYRYCLRSIQESYFTFCELCTDTYQNILWATNNPMSIIILLITYGIIFLALHSFVQAISKFFFGSPEKDVDAHDEWESMGNTIIFGPLYAIYEEEGEDEDWFECYPHLLVIYWSAQIGTRLSKLPGGS